VMVAWPSCFININHAHLLQVPHLWVLLPVLIKPEHHVGEHFKHSE
jgi:hypothetical protein